jgi:peptidoglycan/xylan/chitin deacetylase (PgdA/CDA1 family)
VSRRLRALRGRLLGEPPVVYAATHKPPAVALTFDDGPSPWTAPLAAVLEAHDCRGTFFARGAAIAEAPRSIAELAGAGHVVGNHLWSHSDPERQSRGELEEEIERTAAAIEEAGAVRPDLVRPPYGGAPHAIARAARRTNVRAIVLRSVDPADWSIDSADEIFDRVMAKIGPGDIVCLHDGFPDDSSATRTREHTVAAVERLVPELVQRGLSPVTVPQLLA